MSLPFGLDPQAMVVLVMGLLGLVPVALYYEKTSNWFVYAYGALFVAAVATNLEYVFLPDLLNLTEHVVGNMGAGIAFALAAYVHWDRSSDPGQADSGEGDGEHVAADGGERWS